MKDSIRVLIAHYRPDLVSGAEQAIADFIDQADPRFECTMLTPGKGNLFDFYRYKNYRVIAKRVETTRRRYPGLHTVQSLIYSRELRRMGVDVGLCNTFASASRVRTAFRLAKIPYAIYIREYISDKSIHRRILDEADMVLAVSGDIKNHICKLTDPLKVVLAYDSINPHPIINRVAAHRAGASRLVPFGIEHPVIGFVGRITPYKQPDLFVKSIPLVLSEVPEARFVIVGSAKEAEVNYEASVRRLVDELAIKDKVSFMGQRKDVIEIISELSIFCLTSSREPLARVILEAQLAQCPLIVPDTGGAPEMVEEGISGLTFSSTAPDAAEQLAARIVTLLRDIELQRSMAANAMVKVRSSFAGKKHVRQLEHFFEVLAKKKTMLFTGSEE